MSLSAVVKLEGRNVVVAQVDGPSDVFVAGKFVLLKSRWIGDDEASACLLCANKFNKLRRKHHCRQCGQVLCNKCCKEKVPLPQLGIEEPERVCELCRPVVELVTKSTSSMLKFQIESAEGLVELIKDPDSLIKVIELGGMQSLMLLAKVKDQKVQAAVMSSLQTLSTHEPLHPVLAETGAIKAICSILNGGSHNNQRMIIDGVSSLMVFCKSVDLKTKALSDGALDAALSLCDLNDDTIALLSVSMLSLIVEHPGTHQAVIDNTKNVLQWILNLTLSSDPQMQEVALKTLAHLSMGTDAHRRKIIQEGLSCGHCLQKAITNKSQNHQVLCNAVCLIANLATMSEYQTSMSDLLDAMCAVLHNCSDNTDLLCHTARGLANFSKFQQNKEKLILHLPTVVTKCVKSLSPAVKTHGLRFVVSLLHATSSETTQQLLRDGASEVLAAIADSPGLTGAMEESLVKMTPEKKRPM